MFHWVWKILLDNVKCVSPVCFFGIEIVVNVQFWPCLCPGPAGEANDAILDSLVVVERSLNSKVTEEELPRHKVHEYVSLYSTRIIIITKTFKCK